MIEALKLALEALIGLSIKHGEMTDEGMDAITAIEKALAQEKALQTLHSENERLGLYKDAYAQPEHDSIYVYASSLATAIWQKHYIKDSPRWKPLDTTKGVLTQIDNMTCGLVKEKPAQPEQEPVKIAHRHEWFRTGEMKVGQMRCISCGTWGHEEMPQRTWVDLTRTQMQDVYFAVLEEHRGGHQMEGQLAFGEALQAKLKERNT